MSTPEQTHEEEWTRAMQVAHGKPMRAATDEERRTDTVAALRRERAGVEAQLHRAQQMGEERAMVRDLRSETGFRYRSGPEMVREQERRLADIDAEISRLSE